MYLNNEIRKDVARLHYEAGVFQVNNIDPFHIGRNRSPIYIRSQEFLDKVVLKNKLMMHLENTATELYFDIIAGVETGSMPFSSKLADRLNRPEIYIRKKKVRYAPQIEGMDIKKLKNRRILLIEDTIRSGKTIKDSMACLTDVGAIVKDCIVLYNWQKHDESLFSNTRLHDLTNTTIMLDYLLSSGETIRIGCSTNELKSFIYNPEEWHNKKKIPYYKE